MDEPLYNMQMAVSTPETTVSRALERLEPFEDSTAPPPTLNTDGEFHLVLIREEKGSVVKIVRETIGESRRDGLLFEALITDHAHTALEASRFAIPRVIECDLLCGSPYMEVEYIPGQSFSEDELAETLSDEEKAQLGRDMSEFAYAFSETLSLGQLSKMQEGLSLRIPDREKHIIDYFDRVGNALDHSHPVLTDTIYALQDTHARLQKEGKLEPTIIGHDDLRAPNIILAPADQYGVRRLKGVVDFQITKPSSFERELRHLAPLGEVAVEAAMKRTQELTGRELSREVFDFWAIGQMATTCGMGLRRYGYCQPSRVAYLRRMFPNKDWDELQAV